MYKYRRSLIYTVIFSLVCSLLAQAQQPTQQQNWRILIPVKEKPQQDNNQTGARGQKPQLVLQTGSNEPAAKLVFSQDAALLAVMGASGGSIKLWEVATGRELLTLKPREGSVNFYQTGADFIFSPDGRSLLSYAAGAVRQWEALTGKLLREVSLFDGRGYGTSQFSPDGRLLATFNMENSELKIWDIATGALLRTHRYGMNREKNNFKFANLNSFAFSPDARLLALCEETQDGMSNGLQIVIQEVTGWKTVQSISLQPATSRKDQEKALKKSSREMLDSIASGKAGAQLGGAAMETTNAIPARAVKFTPDGRSLTLVRRDLMQTISLNRAAQLDTPSYSQNVVLKLYDVAGGRESATVNVSDTRTKSSIVDFMASPANTISFSADGGRCLVAGNDSKVKLLELPSGRSLATLSGSGEDYLATAFSVDGKMGATAAYDGMIAIWDISAATTTGKAEIVRTLSSSAMGVGDVAFSPDGRSLIFASAEAVSTWELSAGTAMRNLSIEKPRIKSGDDFLTQFRLASLSDDGKLYFSGDRSAFKVFEARTGAELRTLPVSMKNLAGKITFSSDGSKIAFASKSDRNPVQANSAATPATPATPAATDPSTIAAQIPGATVMTPDQQDKKEKKDKRDDKGSRIGFGGFGGFGRIGGSGDSKQPKADMKEVMRLNKEVTKKQQEYNKAMESGDTAKAGQIMQEMQELTNQMMVASGQAPMQMPSPANAGTPSDRQTQSATPDQSLLDNFMPENPLLQQSIKVLDTTTGREVLAIKGKDLQDFYPSSFALSPDGRLIASAFNGYTIRMTEVATGKDLPNITINRGFMNEAMAFSPEGKYLASVISETRPGVNQSQTNLTIGQRYLTTLRVWDVSNPAAAREVQAINIPDQYPTISFSPDSRIIAVGSSEVKLYDLANGRELLKLSGNTLPVGSIGFSPDGKTLVTGGEDGSVKLWKAQTGELLATLVHLNGGADWLVVTPDGLFDGTPAAWNQILWRFSQNVFDVTPVEVYFNEFFYPGLLADIYSGKQPRATQDVAQKERRQPVVKLSLADGQTGNSAGRNIKVKIDVNEPAGGAPGKTAGARDLRLFRNGTLVKVWRGDVLKGQGRATLEATLPIVAGDNRLVAYAFNRDNVKSSDSTITVTGNESLRRKGNVYVIACGVNQYANSQYNLKYAVADATSFADEVRAQQAKLQQFERVEIISLLDKDATKENILLVLRRLSGETLPATAPASLTKLQAAQPEDVVMIYFAGHGAAQGARFYLVPHDLGYDGARNALTPQAVQTILARSISDLELESAIESLDAGQLLFVLDACNSGQALEAEEKRRGPMNSPGLAQLAYEKGMYILTAAQSYQAALEAAQLGHGYLTFALVEEGLKKGMADRDLKDGQVLTREWFNYATERVPQMQEKNLGSRILLEEEKAKDPAVSRSVQRPRVFYRRELESRPLVIAKP